MTRLRDLRRRCWAPALLVLFSCDAGPDARYATRGLVKEQVGAGADARVAIHHEPLPEFRDRDGKLAPMDAMTMVFGLARGARCELTPGTKLAFEFEVRWATSPFLVITRCDTLPPDTPLALSDSHGH
jgi:hypothetical protein